VQHFFWWKFLPECKKKIWVATPSEAFVFKGFFLLKTSFFGLGSPNLDHLLLQVDK
jgi:hypothetical protein